MLLKFFSFISIKIKGNICQQRKPSAINRVSRQRFPISERQTRISPIIKIHFSTNGAPTFSSTVKESSLFKMVDFAKLGLALIQAFYGEIFPRLKPNNRFLEIQGNREFWNFPTQKGPCIVISNRAKIKICLPLLRWIKI